MIFPNASIQGVVKELSHAVGTWGYFGRRRNGKPPSFPSSALQFGLQKVRKSRTLTGMARPAKVSECNLMHGKCHSGSSDANEAHPQSKISAVFGQVAGQTTRRRPVSAVSRCKFGMTNIEAVLHLLQICFPRLLI
jgi:hypothetical protein